MDEINIGDIERVLNDTRPVTSTSEAQDQQPVHIGGAAEGVVLPPSAEAAPDTAPAFVDEPAGDEPPAAAEAMPESDSALASGQPDEEDEDDIGLIEPAEAIPELPLFSEIGLSDELVRAVTEKGYLHPTPIQAQAIPYVLMGRDVMGVAQTGTGKTAGFTLPMLDILSGSRSRARMPRALVLEPTRELALQVAENFVDYGRHLKLTHALLIGGESMNDQRAALEKGVDVLIATPGRLLDLFERGGLMLNDTKILVIDEADRMLDMGFIPDVEKIVSFVSPMRQTLFFSATMAPEIKRLADAFLQNPKLITVSKAASVAPTIVAGLAVVDEADKRRALRTLISVADVRNALDLLQPQARRRRAVQVAHQARLLGRRAAWRPAAIGALLHARTLQGRRHQDAGLLRRCRPRHRHRRAQPCLQLRHPDPRRGLRPPHRPHRAVPGLTGHAYSIASPDDRLVVDAIERLTGFPIPRIVGGGCRYTALVRDRRQQAPWSWQGRQRGSRRREGRQAASAAASRVAASLAPRRSPTRGNVRARPSGRRGQTRPNVRRAPSASRGRRASSARLAHKASASLARKTSARLAHKTSARLAPQCRAGGSGAGRAFEPRPGEPSLHRGSNATVSPRRDGERTYRRDDLGPSVLGFGDSVPDFMNLPRRAVSGCRCARSCRPNSRARTSVEPDVAIIDATPTFDPIVPHAVLPEEDRVPSRARTRRRSEE